MDISRSREKLNTFLAYVLGRNPYEFGLVPDDNGFVKIKDLLKAVREEDGFRHISAGNLNELTLTVKKPLIEFEGDLVRSIARENLVAPGCEQPVPKLLYIGIRTRAHGHVMNHGLEPFEGQPYVVLSSDRDMAERIGKRRDANPVIITVQAAQAENLGVLFLFGGETIFLARSLPRECLSGPPLVSRDEETSKPRKQKSEDKRTRPTPGSFFLDVSEHESGSRKSKTHKKDRISWKHNKKKIRKQKEKMRGEY